MVESGVFVRQLRPPRNAGPARAPVAQLDRVVASEASTHTIKVYNFGHNAFTQKSARRRKKSLQNAPVAQLDRVVASEAIGRGFESLRARQIPCDRSVPSVEVGHAFALLRHRMSEGWPGSN